MKSDKLFTAMLAIMAIWWVFIISVICAVLYAGYRTLLHFGIF